LEDSRGALAVQRAEDVPERHRAEPAREIHGSMGVTRIVRDGPRSRARARLKIHRISSAAAPTRRGGDRRASREDPFRVAFAVVDEEPRRFGSRLKGIPKGEISSETERIWARFD